MISLLHSWLNLLQLTLGFGFVLLIIHPEAFLRSRFQLWKGGAQLVVDLLRIFNEFAEVFWNANVPASVTMNASQTNILSSLRRNYMCTMTTVCDACCTVKASSDYVINLQYSFYWKYSLVFWNKPQQFVPPRVGHESHEPASDLPSIHQSALCIHSPINVV